MPDFDPAEIRGIVFDLDGTLYVNEPFAATIKAAAVAYIAALLGISTAHAAGIMVVTRQTALRGERYGTDPLGGLRRAGRGCQGVASPFPGGAPSGGLSCPGRTGDRAAGHAWRRAMHSTFIPTTTVS